MPAIGTDPVRTLFTFLDADRDGVLGWGDYHHLAERLVQHYGLSDGAYETIALRSAYTLYWRALLAGGDGSEQVDEKTFFIAHCLTDPGPVFRALNGIVHAALTIAGAGPENRVTDMECHQLLTTLGVAAPAAAQAFVWLDSDNDGKVGCAEFVRAAEGFFLLRDHSAPGAVLFGLYEPPPPPP
ncbi:EF-hand domain-containing protein [Actinomadura sp. ATCC 31491]|uniref:EF-hand domain-containing protein n=1 Tax=Actinomadura luzonensis TaxID=2805427 RepID=A0ABT0G7Q3_9ACTN|nr:EF-hand domain-containing protein [Actinomadura luzonensis]MCK2220428.1 EF-hand domain-containing protein [Actinomadura luzonensis]